MNKATCKSFLHDKGTRHLYTWVLKEVQIKHYTQSILVPMLKTVFALLLSFFCLNNLNVWGVLNTSLKIFKQFREILLWFWLIDFRFITNKMADYNINKSNILWDSYFQRRSYHQSWEINHPGLTFGLLKTCTIRAILFLLYFLRYSLPKHSSGISK